VIKKEKHYLDIINELIPDDTNPGKWKKDKLPIGHY
jgi:hypothetical protein